MHPLRKLRESGKPTPAQVSALLAENIVFNSPILVRPIEGREAIAAIFAQMSITETTTSPQQKLHWLAEQALNWSGLPVTHVRPTALFEGSYLILTSDSVRESNQIRLPFGEGKTSPIAVEDVARVIAAVLANPPPHIRKIYHLTG